MPMPKTAAMPTDRYGVRASGRLAFDRLGTLEYWADGGWVSGPDTRVFYDDEAAGSRVTGTRHVDVSGSAFDLGLAGDEIISLIPNAPRSATRVAPVMHRTPMGPMALSGRPACTATSGAILA